jgi:hypothetical protein
MRSSRLFVVVFVVCAFPAAGLEVQRITRPFALGDRTAVRVEAPVGRLTAQTWDGSSVEVELALDCSGKLAPCREAARQVALRSEASGDTLVIRLEGPEKFGQETRTWLRWTTLGWSWTPEGKKRRRLKSKALESYGWDLAVNLRVLLPRSPRLEVLMEHGDVIVNGLEADGKVSVAKGSALISMRRRDAGTLTLHSGKGEAMIRPVGERALKGKKSLEWKEGSGDCDLEVELGAGPIVVELF